MMLLAFPTVAAIDTSYGVIIDAGSSGTRAHVYSWPTGLPEVMSESSKSVELKIEPGISAFADRSAAAIDSYLAPLLVAASLQVPFAAQPQTRLRIYATAGMRLLSASRQRPIWNSVRASVLNHTRFAFLPAEDARTLSGEYEGLFNWMALRHILGDTAPALFGGLDLGGASTQITFEPPDVGGILQDSYYVRDRNEARPDVRVYSHSYMLAGKDEAQRRLFEQLAVAAPALDYSSLYPASMVPEPRIANPCMNRGYEREVSVGCGGGAGACRTVRFTGLGNWDECRRLVDSLLHLDYECVLPPCALSGVYQPNPTGVRFFASDFFFYVANGIGLVSWNGQWDGSWAEFAAAGRTFCGRHWSEVASEYAADFCFGSAYVPALLGAYGIPADSRVVTYVRELEGFDVGWTLGAMLFELTSGPYAEAAACGPSSSPRGVWDAFARPVKHKPTAIQMPPPETAPEGLDPATMPPPETAPEGLDPATAIQMPPPETAPEGLDPATGWASSTTFRLGLVAGFAIAGVMSAAAYLVCASVSSRHHTLL